MSTPMVSDPTSDFSDADVRRPGLPDCTDCEGHGSYPCPLCNGNNDCGECGGAGVVDCSDCEATEGYLCAVGSTTDMARLSRWRGQDAANRGFVEGSPPRLTDKGREAVARLRAERAERGSK